MAPAGVTVGLGRGRIGNFDDGSEPGGATLMESWADFAFFGRTDVAGVRGLEHVRAQYRCPSDRVSSPAGSSLSTKTHDVETMFWTWAQEDGEGGWRLAFIPPSPHKDLQRPWIILPLQLYQLQHGAAGGDAPQSARRQAFPVSGRRMNARRWLQVSSPVAVDVRVAGRRPPVVLNPSLGRVGCCCTVPIGLSQGQPASGERAAFSIHMRTLPSLEALVACLLALLDN